MQYEALLAHVKQTYGIEPDDPWQEGNACVLRHAQTGKWFALLMRIDRSKLGLEGEGPVVVVNLKCAPQLIGSLRGQPGIHPAYHMNKDHWLTVRLDDSVPDETVKQLVAHSYGMTAPKPTRRKPGPSAVPRPEDWQW